MLDGASSDTPFRSASTRTAQVPFVGPLTLAASALFAGSLAEAAPGASRRAFVYFPDEDGNVTANICLSFERGLRRRPLGSGAFGCPKEGAPASSSPVDRTGTVFPVKGAGTVGHSFASPAGRP